MINMITDELMNIYNKEKLNNSLDIFSVIIESLSKLLIDKWNNCSHDFLSIDSPILESKEKKQNELITNIFLTDVILLANKFDNACDNEFISAQLKTCMIEFSKKTGFFNLRISREYPCDFIKATSDFIRISKEFDSHLKFSEISQALRNVWTMNLLQSIFSMKIQITPSVFSYSLLYPYTDNLLDKNSIDANNKTLFCNKVHNRLLGNFAYCSNEAEAKVFNLIGMIETEFPRAENYSIFKSLCSINFYQGKSIDDQGFNAYKNIDDLLDRTVKKGGTSVLSDGFLLKSKLSIEDMLFSFSFGVLLQLLDDFQDVKSDTSNGHNTIFTIYAYNNKLDNMACKLINFLDIILSILDLYEAPYIKNIKKAIKSNCLLIIFFTITRNKKLFSKEFISYIEKYYPFTDNYMKNFNKKLTHNYKKLSKISKATLIDLLNVLS